MPGDPESPAAFPHTAEFEPAPADSGAAPPAVARARNLRPVPLLAAPIALAGLLLVVLWGLHLSAQLAGLRRAADAPGVLTPGSYEPASLPLARSGDWFTQSYGGTTQLVSNSVGSSLQVRFFGSALWLTALVGPESGRLYAAIDGRPVAGLRSDPLGSYLSLKAGQAQDRRMLVVRGLSPAEHVVTLSAGGGGDAALVEITVASEPVFPWAVTLLEVTALGAFAAIFLAAGRALSERREATGTTQHEGHGRADRR